MKLECQSCRAMNDRHSHYCQQCQNLPRSTKEAKDVSECCAFVWTSVIRGFESPACAKTKHNLEARSQAHQAAFTGVLDRYEKGATYVWRMDTDGVAVGDLAGWRRCFTGAPRFRCRSMAAINAMPSMRSGCTAATHSLPMSTTTRNLTPAVSPTEREAARGSAATLSLEHGDVGA